VSDFEVAAILITLTAGLAYINARVLRLPSAIGLMSTALLGSIVVIALDALQATEVTPRVALLLEQVNLSHALLHGMLGILLFAGALHVDRRSARVSHADRDARAGRDGALDRTGRRSKLCPPGRPRSRRAARLLPGIRCADLADRSDRGARDPQGREGAQEPRGDHHRGVAVQRWRRRRVLPGNRRGRGGWRDRRGRPRTAVRAGGARRNRVRARGGVRRLPAAPEHRSVFSGDPDHARGRVRRIRGRGSAARLRVDRRGRGGRLDRGTRAVRWRCRIRPAITSTRSGS
jgi:hypothetical protein